MLKNVLLVSVMFIVVIVSSNNVYADQDDVFDRFIQSDTGEVDCTGTINGDIGDEGSTAVDGETPCNGNFRTYATSQDRLRTSALFAWSADNVDEMRNDGKNNEYIDITSDDECGLEIDEVSTNIPNHGPPNQKNDECNHLTEAEVHINPETISTGQYVGWYWFDVEYNCKKTGTQVVTLTYEHDKKWHNGISGRDWLSETSSECANTRSANRQQKSSTTSKSTTSKMVMSKNKQEYSYAVSERNGEYDVAVAIDFDYDNLSKHVEDTNPLNRKSNKVFQTGIVAVTFHSPLTVEQTNSFVEKTGIEVLNYGLFGKNEKDKNDIISIYRFFDGDSENIFSFENTWESDANGIYDVDGIMTIRGVINIQSIQIIESDSNVALVDTTGIEVRAEIYDELGVNIDPEDISLSSPAWHVYDNITEVPTSVSVQLASANSKTSVGYTLLIGIFTLVISALAIHKNTAD